MLRVQALAEAFATSRQTPALRSVNPQLLPKSLCFATHIPKLDPPGHGDSFWGILVGSRGPALPPLPSTQARAGIAD